MWIGETVSIILTKQQQATPFYYSCSETGAERLAVFIQAERIPILIIFETQLCGVEALCKQIRSGAAFQGKILSMTNISFGEGNVYAPNLCRYTDDIQANEILTEKSAITVGECLGVVGIASGGSS